MIKFSLPGLSLSESTNKGVNQRSKHVTQVQQQRPESPTIPLTWHACKGNVIGAEKVLFVGASVPLSALKILQSQAVKGLTNFRMLHRLWNSNLFLVDSACIPLLHYVTAHTAILRCSFEVSAQVYAVGRRLCFIFRGEKLLFALSSSAAFVLVVIVFLQTCRQFAVRADLRELVAGAT